MAATEQWLKNEKAAEMLGISTRTIKRWKKNPARRKALGTVKHGEQQRIPLPKNIGEDAWERVARDRLEKIGIRLKGHSEKALEEHWKRGERNKLETYRFWLAARLQLLTRPEAITAEDRTAILNLWQAACKILSSQPKGTEVDKLKSEFPKSLRAGNFSEERLRSIVSYWPREKCFEGVRAATTFEQLEEIRRWLDFSEASKTCQNLGKDSAHDNIAQLLHKDFMTHINDTRYEIPKDFKVLKNPTPEQMQELSKATTWLAMEHKASESTPEQMQKKILWPPVVIDFRQPQKKVSLRTVKSRYPLKKSRQKKIVAAIYSSLDKNPSIEEKFFTGKKPIRDSNT